MEINKKMKDQIFLLQCCKRAQLSPNIVKTKLYKNKNTYLWSLLSQKIQSQTLTNNLCSINKVSWCLMLDIVLINNLRKCQLATLQQLTSVNYPLKLFLIVVYLISTILTIPKSNIREIANFTIHLVWSKKVPRRARLLM